MKVGIIGFGKAASEGHLPAFRALGLNVVGIADVSKGALKRVHKKGIKCFTEYHELLKENLDFVSVCTPSYLHSKISMNAAENGINILVEKPLALNLDDALKIKKKIKKEGVKLCIVHNYKYLEPFIRTKRMYDEGNLGKILAIHTIVHHSSPPAHKNWKLDETKSGSMLFEWIHPIYLQLLFGKKPNSVFAVGNRVAENYPTIRDVKVLIKFESSTGYLEMSQFCTAPLFALNVIGTGASIYTELPVRFRIRAPSTPINAFEEIFSSFTDVIKLGRMFLDMRKPYLKFAWGSHFLLIKKFVEAIKKDLPSPVPICEGIESIRLVRAIEDSMNAGKKITI